MAVDPRIPLLIVDDDRAMLRTIRGLLNRLGFANVDQAADGRLALERLRRKHYRLVISDWNMAPMTGLQLLTEMRADGRLNATPFIMVTAESTAEKRVAAKDAGANGYIVKPFGAAMLKSKLQAVLGRF